MENPEKPAPNSDARAIVYGATSAFDALVDSAGRRGIRIFGWPRNQLVMASVAAILFVLPIAAFIGMLPFWDRVAELSPNKQLNAYIAPAVEIFRHEFPDRYLFVKRFLVSCVAMVELIFLGSLASVFSRRVRKHALLVWMYFDRDKLHKYMCISGVTFCGLWYVLFVDWRFGAFIADRNPGYLVLLMMAIPFAAFVFGHMIKIACLGCCRDFFRSLRRGRGATT